MGRTTFESLGGRPQAVAGPGGHEPAARSGRVEAVSSIEEALARAGESDVWFIGGARIYEEAMSHCDIIDVTFVPDRIDAQDAVRAPAIDERVFEPGPLVAHEDEAGLTRRVYTRRAQARPS